MRRPTTRHRQREGSSPRRRRETRFTVSVLLASDGTILPMKATYSGKNSRSCPSPNAQHYDDQTWAGFILEESGKRIRENDVLDKLKTTRSFIDQILAPNYDNAKV
ncbi:hypothetical protein GALMADRAFT_225792 [Galerina marginata CBS 339.88]|uniref:Uncharacterized protein n=1 Tax=Galerina marginata (strain CBS 339.88) TaxID=685588 RepID=A0A067SYT6_GALM3|nr:hypothetical protein GALMADRAFT_225792 [Galerina marginata CBS 339.88]